MLNTYTLEVYRKQEKPCFVVTIKHIMKAGVYFFNTLNEANKYISDTKKELEIYAPLSYNNKGVNDDKYINIIKMVLSCKNIHIGKDGKTYYNEKIC